MLHDKVAVIYGAGGAIGGAVAAFAEVTYAALVDSKEHGNATLNESNKAAVACCSRESLMKPPLSGVPECKKDAVAGMIRPKINNSNRR